MLEQREHDAKALLAATLDWWRDAGVDSAFIDNPADWLESARSSDADDSGAAAAAQPAPDRRARAAAKPPLPGTNDAPARPAEVNRAAWPTSLADFAAWWLTDPAIDDAPAAYRVAPSGPANAPLMVLLVMPEQGDDAALAAGPTGKLLDAMLAAMGLSRAEIYLASALPSRIAVPEWPVLAARGLADVLRHHVALAAPQRLLVFGRAGISTLLGHDLANKAADSPFFNHEGVSLPFVAAYDLETLLAKPALKAGLWNRWLETTGTDKT
ncbi:uracil-DNA glycosylase family protein [Novosphingobium lentum]|uniref:uracil-DNA glycosylase family protein n=1 Tax=Novosphingobium lentum TaxID=145287 RepID=UPI000A7E24F3|nr:uracil-DNA glycosylase family protein [Novosphingobium lentum]